MITCKTATALHTAAEQGGLSGFDRLRYRLHMAVCPPCRAYARGLEQTVEALGELPAEAAPDEVKQALVERLRARRRGS
jgi:anti-sigma factor RsiW